MNVFSITGNLGRDCRVGNAGGTPVCNFAVAVKSGFGQHEQTVWVDCALWGKQAESRLPEYLIKGQQVAVSGELGTREHEGKMYITLRVNQVSLIGAKQDHGQQQTPAQGSQQQASGQQQGNWQQQQRQQTPPVYNEPPADFDDDIPFAPIGLQYRALWSAM